MHPPSDRTRRQAWPLLIGVLFCGAWTTPSLAEFRYEGDLSLRLDDRSGRELREQYRLRFEPEYHFADGWSAHAFVATGLAFSSAYNTFGESDDLHLRRLFGRYAWDNNKIEFGVLPPYKGRVSSTGLSDEGWIRGVRGVFGIGDDRLELVVGDLSDLRASNAFSSPYELNYFELEWSGRINDRFTYELGGERMLDENYARAELRLTTSNDVAWSAEVVHGFDSNAAKSVLSVLAPFRFGHGELEWFTYYAYVPLEFGRRAALTEDFLGFGHSFGMELDYQWRRWDRLTWFLELETGDARDRAKLGIEIDFGR